ncbi:thioesterase II family protein [Rhizobium rhizogenes]|uniref:thioesterase II family protein n=1 Tax=Rhizobium rhizogenes TaxID=359 RepID=UPI0012956145|nr:alpha/beta fold hydrolase [Rhizobium rhizogenes]MQB34215.1 thioesterase [Rhizobium rhizogenes]
MPHTLISPWIRFRRPSSKARIRLLCFPYAGGGASIYRSWPHRFPEWVDVCPVQLPGREERIAEPAFSSADALCSALVPMLSPLLDLPIALFGHSMGASLAYETAIRVSGKVDLVHLFISSQRAPDRLFQGNRSNNLSSAELQERLVALDGTPDRIIANSELMNLLLPLFRADFSVSENYHRDPLIRLLCDISVFGGLDDIFNEGQLIEWHRAAAGKFDFSLFPGNHFFLRHNEAAVVEKITRILAKVAWGDRN